MIFNRYLLLCCAGYLTAASAVTSETETQKVRTGFKRLAQLLNKSYDGSCETHVTGEGATPTTFVACTRPGGTATLTANGAVNPVPEALEVCAFGADMKQKCESLELTGRPREDLQKAYAFLHGLLTRKLQQPTGPQEEDEWLVKLLNETYGGTCQVRVVGTYSQGKHHVEGPTTFYDCVRPGAEAVLAVKDNVPVSLEVCSFGEEMKETCTSLVLSGNEEEDKPKVNDILSGHSSGSGGSGRIVGTDFDMLVELLNGAFDNQCKVRATGTRPSAPHTYVVCTRPGGYATLASDGTTNPVPTKFSVCEQGVEMQGKCDSIQLSGNTTKDIPAVKTALGMKN